MTASEKSQALAEVAAHAADEKNARDIAVLDVSDLMAIADIFLVASADNERQVRAVVEEIEDKLTERGEEPLRREGNRENRWVLLDYGGLVIHVQRDAEREFYGLDRLYRECPLIEVAGIEVPERPGKWAAEVDPRQVESLEEIPLAADGPDDGEREL